MNRALLVIVSFLAAAAVISAQESTTTSPATGSDTTTASPAAGGDATTPPTPTYLSCVERACPASMECYGSVITRKDFDEEKWSTDFDYVWTFVTSVPCLEKATACVCSSECATMESPWAVQDRVCNELSGSGSDSASGSDSDSGSDDSGSDSASGSDSDSGSDSASGSDSDSGSDSASDSDSDSGSDSASGSDSDSDTRPDGVCCKAMTAACLSCAAGMHMDNYCEVHPDTVGCPNPCLMVDCAPGYVLVGSDERGCGGECHRACCDAVNAECEACNAGVSVEEMCARRPDLEGCPQTNMPACISDCFTSDADMPATPADWCLWAKGARDLKCTMDCDDEVWARQEEFLKACADDKPCAMISCPPDHELVGADDRGCGGECSSSGNGDGPPACLKACFPDGGFPTDPADLCDFARAAPKKPCFAECLDDKVVMGQREEFLRRCEEDEEASGSAGSSSSSGDGDDDHCKRCATSFLENGGCELMKTGSADAVDAAIPEGCHACGDEAARICGMEDEGDSEHCRECAEEFVLKGGCDVLKDPKKVKALIPDGCMPCGEAAARMCFDETDESDSDSDDDDGEGPPRCIERCFKDGAIPKDPRFNWCEWLLEGDKPANCFHTCSRAVMEEKKEFEQHCKEVLHLPEDGDEHHPGLTCKWPAVAIGHPRRWVLEVLRREGAEKLKVHPEKALCAPVFANVAEAVVAGEGLEDALLLNRTALEGICLPACPVREMLGFVDDVLQHVVDELCTRDHVTPPPPTTPPPPPTTTTADDGDHCRRCAKQFHQDGGCDAMRSGKNDLIKKMIPSGCDTCAAAAYAQKCFGDTGRLLPTACAAAECPAALSCYSDSVASRMMFNEERWVHDATYVDEMLDEVSCLSPSLACLCTRCGDHLSVWPVADDVCEAVTDGADRRLESEPMRPPVEGVERTLSAIHGAVERARDLHEIICAVDTKYDDSGCYRCATEFMSRGGCEAWASGDEKKTRSLIPSGCEPCEKTAAKLCGHHDKHDEHDEEEYDEEGEKTDTALCLGHLAELDAKGLCTTGCAQKLFSKFDKIFRPILGDKTAASEVLSTSLCARVRKDGGTKYCTDLLHDIEAATDADRVLAAAPGLCVENAAGERPCLDAARAIADRFGSGEKKTDRADFCTSAAAAAGEKVRTDTESELTTDRELSSDEERDLTHELAAKIRKRVADKLKLSEDRVFVLVIIRKAKAERRMRALSAANSYTAKSTIVLRKKDAAALPPSDELYRVCVKPAAVETAAVTDAAATASDTSSEQVTAAAFSFDKGEDIATPVPETPAAGVVVDDDDANDDDYLLGFSKQTVFLAAAGAAGVVIGAAVLAVMVRRRNRSGRALQRRHSFRLNEVEGAAANPAGKIELYDATAKV